MKKLIVFMMVLAATALFACETKSDEHYVMVALSDEGKEVGYLEYINREFKFPTRHELFLKADGNAVVKEYTFTSGFSKKEYNGKYAESKGKIKVALDNGKEMKFERNKKRLVYNDEKYQKIMIDADTFIEDTCVGKTH